MIEQGNLVYSLGRNMHQLYYIELQVINSS